MEFLILGPLEARVGERTLPLGGPKQRSLLALLLLHRNEAVSTDRLTDGLWGEQPPATAGKVVQVYVSRLRRLLGPAGEGGGRLVTRPPGYLLRLDPDELDLDRFEALVERAGRAMATGDAAAAAEALRRGLALWRGPALADLAFEPFAQAAAAGLEEQRLAALESRLEADLALGRAPELIGELGALVGEHPLRERLRRSLVLALYRAGRQAEALEAYRAARRALVQDLGIEPGPELAELEGAILRHDPALAPRSSPASPVPPAPDPPTASPAPTGSGGRAQARDGPVLRHRGLDRAHGALGRRGDARAAGPLPRARPRRGGPLRRHGEQAAGRRLHGPDGRAGRHEDHALRAVLAALGLRRRLAEGALASDDSAVPIRVRMGLDSGLVVLATMGDPGAEPTAIGEIVVVAERVQRLAEPGAILAGEESPGWWPAPYGSSRWTCAGGGQD